MFLCILVAEAALCHAQVPQAQVVMSSECYSPSTTSSQTVMSEGFYSSSTTSTIESTFVLNRAIESPFTVYAVVIFPDGSMRNCLGLNAPLKPVATKMTGLPAPFTYPLLSLPVPVGAPFGLYEVVVAFFDPSRPITGRQDAFLAPSGKFTIGSCTE